MKISRMVLPLCVLLCVLTGCGRAEASPSAENPAETGGTAAPEPAPESFTDIEGHPAEEYILDGLDRGFWLVPADGLFRPDEPVTQAEFADAVWRVLGQPAPSDGGAGDSTAGDGAAEETAVPDSGGAAAWLRAYGEVFPWEPEQDVTRQAAMNLLFTCNGSVSGPELMFTRLYDDGFKDSGEIPPGGKPALYWGFYNVLIRETGPETISPSAPVSRGDMAEILVRFAEDFLSEETDAPEGDSSLTEDAGNGPTDIQKEESMK